jgi:hypothetical protein
MRNLSMKKFGTPIGRGPGTASERPGLVSAGAPSASRRSLPRRRAGRSPAPPRASASSTTSPVTASTVSPDSLRLVRPVVFWRLPPEESGSPLSLLAGASD